MKKTKQLIASILTFALAATAIAPITPVVQAFAETGGAQTSEIQTSSVQQPSIYAESAILVEADTGKVLFSKDEDKRMYPASMTKILTSLIFLEYFEPNDIITVGTEINDISLDSSKAGHVVGESITAENLVRGLIIPSGNDSAAVAACAVARKYSNDDSLSNTQCEQIFAELMNKKAEELGCTGSNFVNPHGYHDENHYTTASDMAKISIAGMQNETIKKIASEQSFSGNGLGSFQQDGLESQDYNWTSHNLLITNSDYNYQYASGIKTGFTDEAGDCVAAYAEKDGVRLVAVVFNSEDPNRWIDAKNLFEYGFNNFGYFTINKAGDTVATADLIYNKSDGGNTLDLIINEEITLFLAKTEVGSLKTNINVTATDLIAEKQNEDSSSENTVPVLKAPISKDAEIGTISYVSQDGTVLAETQIYSSRDVEKANIFLRMWYNIKTFVSNFIENINIIKVVIIILVIIIIILLIKILKGRRNRNRYTYSRPKYKYRKRRRF